MLTDYTTLTAADIPRLMDDAIATADRHVTAAVADSDPRTYDNTLGPIDTAVTVINDANGVGGFMGQVHPDEEVRTAGTAAEERAEKWLAGLAFRRDLYDAVAAFAATPEAEALAGERRRNLEFWLRDFRRAGHDLSDADRAEVEGFREKVIELNIAFEANLSAWQDGIDVTRDQLDGLPDGYVARLSPGEQADTYRVTVAYPDYVPFMNEARDRDLRRELAFRFLNRAPMNVALLNEVVAVRWEMARRLGYVSFGDYAMEPKMASPDDVAAFYGSIVPGLTRIGERERAALQELLERDHPGATLEPWDWLYYDTLQRRLEFGVDDNEVAGYFALDDVMGGVFDICGEVFGIDFAPVADPQGWHADVAAYAVSDRSTGEVLAHFYTDLHPRPGKYGHAACWRLRAGVRTPEGYRTPVATIVANFTKPTADAPSLLKHDEVVTLFHEFGHVLHNTLTEVELPRFSGTQTERDFVEAPSQIMENWMWDATALARLARHHRSGDPIPADLIDRMVAARDQNVALKTLRQVFYGYYDLELHAGDEPGDADDAYAEHIGLTLFPPFPGTHFGASFGHMASDGYAAGYYGYLWSKVYGDDMYSVFEREGILDPGVGMRYRMAILARGGTRDGLDLLRGFLEREPSSAAFLHRIGLDAV